MSNGSRFGPLLWTFATLVACSSDPSLTTLPDAATSEVATSDVPPVDVPPVDDVPPLPDVPLPPDDAPGDTGTAPQGRPCHFPFECASDPAGRVCNVPQGEIEGRCAECLSGTLCDDGVTVCNRVGRCLTTCASDADCEESEVGPRCNTATSACVACLARSDCAGSSSYCNAATNRCESGCGADADCAGRSSFGTPTTRCDAARRSCEQCVVDAHCGAGQVCSGNRCRAGCSAESPCPSPQACCAGACVDTGASTAHCGRCGNACPVPAGAPATCAAGACGVGACAAGRADCDRTLSNGCEVNTNTSVTDCGGCGVACPTRANAAATCAAGACGFACTAGFGDCDRDPANGCEVDLRTSTAHCGACGRGCAAANGTATCASSACVVTCDAGYLLMAGACVSSNPCATGNGGCHASATCAPGAPGARTCACNSGFVGDGMTCAPESTCSPACGATQTCVNRVCVGSGPLRVSLVWDVAGDMDLHLVTSGGVEIFYGRRSAGGGQLDRDDTSGTGPENVYWSAAPLTGTYLVCVVPYRIPRATNFTLTVNQPGVPAQRFTGSRASSTGNAGCSRTSPHFVGAFTL